MSNLQPIFAAGEHPDWPEVDIVVDRQDPFAKQAADWRGFDPDQILSFHSPLVHDHLGRRVAVRRCSCGEAGCGVTAPVIIASPDGRTISWTDFRGYTGVFVGPEADHVPDRGSTWDLAPLQFDRQQYIEEVARATADRSWETDRRKAARLLRDQVRRSNLTIPKGKFEWVAPQREDDGFLLSFVRRSRVTRADEQVLLRLTSTATDPHDIARDLASRLVATKPARWVDEFGWSWR